MLNIQAVFSPPPWALARKSYTPNRSESENVSSRGRNNAVTLVQFLICALPL